MKIENIQGTVICVWSCCVPHAFWQLFVLSTVRCDIVAESASLLVMSVSCFYQSQRFDVHTFYKLQWCNGKQYNIIY